MFLLLYVISILLQIKTSIEDRREIPGFKVDNWQSHSVVSLSDRPPVDTHRGKTSV